ncbi:hypothetical protein GCM10010275_13530 [Streptomyces litmocidini]|nr:hypothetical protein GCM10010275_13530 [Streptomyces litmocidini]
MVPALSDWTGAHANDCSDGNVIDRSGRQHAPTSARRGRMPCSSPVNPVALPTPMR